MTLPTTNGIHASCLRLFEWIAAAICFTIGLQVFFIPEAVAQSRFRALYDLITPDVLSDYALAVGAFRILALFFHGRLAFGSVRTCAAIRAISALCCAGLWFQMEMALIENSNETNAAYSVGVPVYLWLTVGEIVSIHRAAVDVYRG